MKATSPQIDSFLEQIGGAGSHDSEGYFTLSGRKAAGKLAQCQLPEAADWVLKIVQACCRAGSSKLEVVQSRSSTQFKFRLPFVLHREQLEASLTKGLIAPQAGVEELSMALRAVGLGQNRPWVGSFTSGTRRSWLVLSDELSREDSDLSAEATPAPERATDVVLGVSFPKGERGKLGGVVRFGAAVQNEFLALVSRARACPIPLSLDNRRIDDLQRTGELPDLVTSSLLGITFTSGGEEPIGIPKGLRESEGFRFQDKFTDPSPFVLAEQPCSASSLQRWSYGYQIESYGFRTARFKFHGMPAPSRVVLIRDGVEVGRGPLGIVTPIAVEVFLSANSRRGDLSNLVFDVEKDDVVRARRELAKSEPFLETLLSRLRSHSSWPLRTELAVCGGVGALALVATPLFIKGLVGAAAAFRLAKSAKNHQEIVQDCCLELEAFRRYLAN